MLELWIQEREMSQGRTASVIRHGVEYQWQLRAPYNLKTWRAINPLHGIWEAGCITMEYAELLNLVTEAHIVPEYCRDIVRRNGSKQSYRSSLERESIHR